MILICGIPSEPPIAAVIDRLETSAQPYVLLNQRDVADCALRWSMSGGQITGMLTIGRREYPLESFNGVYTRLMDDRMLPELEDESPNSMLRRASRTFHESLIGWVDVAPGRIVNRFRCMGSNGSKPFQAQLIRRAGFSIPDTLITNDPERASAFAELHGRVIYKSVSGVRSIVAEMNEADWERIDAIRACPVQFQAHVPGYDVRVHTIGAEIFATRIDSPGTDYRYAGHGEEGTRLTPYELPDSLARRCVDLASSLSLDFAGIDLRITPQGDVVCFEVNPSPAYSYYEAHTGQPISLALAAYLGGITLS